jgi:hypothetical protein
MIAGRLSHPFAWRGKSFARMAPTLAPPTLEIMLSEGTLRGPMQARDQ